MRAPSLVKPAHATFIEIIYAHASRIVPPCNCTNTFDSFAIATRHRGSQKGGKEETKCCRLLRYSSNDDDDEDRGTTEGD